MKEMVEERRETMKDRKRHVLRVAQRLFIEQGFPATSIQHILDEANISKGTFYNYFKSKDDCLKAILQKSYEEAVMLRSELLTEQNKKDPAIFAEQVALRLVINREDNLLPLYEAVFYSGNRELMSFLEEHFKEELLWIAERLIDLHGEEIRPYAPDLSIMFTGMIQQYLNFSRPHNYEVIDARALVSYLVNIIDYIATPMVRDEYAFVGSSIFQRFDIPTSEVTVTSEELIEELEQFQQECLDLSKMQLEYFSFLIEELQRTPLRPTLLNTILREFRASFMNTRWESEAKVLSTMIWKYIAQEK